jgi:hypothetical protein
MKADDLPESAAPLRAALFDAVADVLPSLAHPDNFMMNRAGEVCTILAACVSAGRVDCVRKLLAADLEKERGGWFVDMGSEARGLAGALGCIADEHFAAVAALPPRAGDVTLAATAVWDKLSECAPRHALW